MAAGDFNYKSNSQTDDLLLAAIKRLGEIIESNTGTNPDAVFEYRFVASDYNYGNRSQTDDLLEEIVNRLNDLDGGGGGGGGGTDTHLGNADLAATANRRYNINGFGFDFRDGATIIASMIGARFFMGKDGLQYRFPDERNANAGRILVTEAGGNLTFRDPRAPDVFVVGGTKRSGWLNRQTILLAQSPVVDIAAPASEVAANMTVLAEFLQNIAFLNNDQHVNNVVRYQAQIVMTGTIAAAPKCQVVVGVATALQNQTQLVFTKILGVIEHDLLPTAGVTNYISGNIGYTAGANQVIVFGLYNPQSSLSNCTGNVFVNAKLSSSPALEYA
jgi:hypothetical protein